MKKIVVTLFIIGFVGYVNAQFTYPNTNEIHTSDELVIPVIRISNELRLPNTFAPNDPSIGTLDNTGYGINIHKTEGIGFAFNNVHRVFFTPNGSIRTSSSNPAIHIEGTGTGNYQGANLILSAKGVTSGNSHVSTWFMTHRGVNGTAAIEMQRRGRNNEYNGSLLTYSDGDGWRFNTAANKTSGISNALVIKSTGNLGIGTNAPTAKLEIKNNGTLGGHWNPGQSFLTISDTGTSSMIIDSNEIYGSGTLHIGTKSGDIVRFRTVTETSTSEKMIIKANGDIGISTINPQAKLHINSNADVGRGQNPALLVGTRDGLHIAIDNNEIGAFSNNSNAVLYLNGSQSTSNTIINGDGTGNVGIGTNNPNGWKLAVNGKIRAKEIKVETGWADYIFAENYNLPTLKDVENHIKEKGHLQNIPSAEEVEKNGIELGEMNKKLLEKIEELTLYTIQQQKQINNQQEINKALENRLKKLEKLVIKE